MSAPARASNRRLSLPRRVLRGLFQPFRFCWNRFLHASPLFQILIVAVFLGGGIAAGISAYYFYDRRTTGVEWAKGWREYVDAKDRGNLDGMKSGLDRALAVRPGDAVATQKRRDLENEEASPEDIELAIVLMNHHMKANRLHEMAREAAKIRKTFPKDWRAICVQAHYAWHTDGVTAARERLLELPNPDDSQARVDVGGLLYSLQLFENMGRDAGDLRGLIVRRLLPILRSPSAASASPSVKINLIECYLEPFADPANREVLANYWADASKLADLAADTAIEEGDMGLLIRLGRLGPKLNTALQGLKVRQNLTISEERFALLRQEIDERSRKVWDAVLTREPSRVEGHIGAISLAWASGDAVKVNQAIENALATCGERTELLAQLGDLAVRSGQSEKVFNRIWAAAERNPTDVNAWYLAAMISRFAKRQDKVLEACERALKIDPGNVRFALLQADWHLEQNQPQDAIRVLGGAKIQPLTLREPEVIRRQARSLAAMDTPVESYLKEIDTTAVTEKRPSVPVLYAALEGMFQADPPRPTRDALIARVSGELATREPNGPTTLAARALAASASARRAEYVTPAWQREAVHEALQAIDLLPAEVKLSPQVRLMTAKLRLKGMKDYSQAAIDAAPLLEDRFNSSFHPDALEVLGLILLHNRKPDEAVKLLEYASARPNANAGIWIALSLALHKVGRYDEARAALQHPEKKFFKLSPRENAEWQAAAQTLQQESP